LIKSPKGVINPAEIAKEEFKKVKIPMTIRRELPSGEKITIDIKKGIKNWLEEHKGEII